MLLNWLDLFLFFLALQLDLAIPKTMKSIDGVHHGVFQNMRIDLVLLWISLHIRYIILCIWFYFIIDMFKKRATKKQTNIEDLLTEITTTQLVAEGQENSKEMDKGDIENAGEGKNMKINRNVNVHRNRNKMTGEEYDDISEDAVVLNDKIINDKLLEKQNGENNKT